MRKKIVIEYPDILPFGMSWKNRQNNNIYFVNEGNGLVDMTKNEKEKLNIMIDAIKEKTTPQKIILFGSFAKGTEKEDSDIDICIITDKPQRKIDMLNEIRLSTIDKIDIPFDILIYRKKEFNERAKRKNSFENQINEEGVLLSSPETEKLRGMSLLQVIL